MRVIIDNGKAYSRGEYYNSLSFVMSNYIASLIGFSLSILGLCGMLSSFTQKHYYFTSIGRVIMSFQMLGLIATVLYNKKRRTKVRSYFISMFEKSFLFSNTKAEYIENSELTLLKGACTCAFLTKDLNILCVYSWSSTPEKYELHIFKKGIDNYLHEHIIDLDKTKDMRIFNMKALSLVLNGTHSSTGSEELTSFINAETRKTMIDGILKDL